MRAGLHSPRVLLLLMAIWVFTPFVAMLVALKMAKRWAAPVQSTLYGTTLVLTLGTLAVYADDALGHRTAQAAFVYVMAPPASITVLAVALFAAWLSARTSSNP